MSTRTVLRIRSRATLYRVAALTALLLPVVLAACGGDGSGGGRRGLLNGDQAPGELGGLRQLRDGLRPVWPDVADQLADATLGVAREHRRDLLGGSAHRRVGRRLRRPLEPDQGRRRTRQR